MPDTGDDDTLPLEQLSEMGPVTLRSMLSLYSWHCRHHQAHVTTLRSRRGW